MAPKPLHTSGSCSYHVMIRVSQDNLGTLGEDDMSDSTEVTICIKQTMRYLQITSPKVTGLDDRR